MLQKSAHAIQILYFTKIRIHVGTKIAKTLSFGTVEGVSQDVEGEFLSGWNRVDIADAWKKALFTMTPQGAVIQSAQMALPWFLTH